MPDTAKKEKTKKTFTKLTGCSLLLAIIVAPVGVVVSIIALVKAGDLANRLGAIGGIIIGSLFTIFLYFFIPFAIWLAGIQISPNPTVDQSKPIVSAIESFDGKKICDRSYNGQTYGPHGPSYSAYYRVKDANPPKDETDNDKLKSALDESSLEMQFGFLSPHLTLGQDISKQWDMRPMMNELEKSKGTSKFLSSSANETYDSIQNITTSDNLKVEIYRAGPVVVACDDNREYTLSSGEAIVHFVLERKPLESKQILWHSY